ncbi:Chloroperoxidase [Xylaria sp. FL0064]|nr:Chloroperoxidase [Xylaria sp. FL0064]
MRFVVAIVGAIAAASAFPTIENLARLAQRNGSLSLHNETWIAEFSGKLARLKQKKLLFDPLTHPIDVSGKHAFRAPDFENGDQRGPCPGLNALANHGYIPHDGVVGLLDLIEQANTVFGVSIDLVAILASGATLYVGTSSSLNPGFSIGGMSPKTENVLGNLFGLLGKPRGLDGTHNIIECDSSATRNDLYNTGNAHTMNLTLFQKILEFADDGFITMDDLADRAVERFHESIATNPTFYYGPYTGTIARNAGYAFLGRFISNHTKEYPQGGHLSKEVMFSFFGVHEENGGLVYREGHERIPENWYRIAVDYSLTDYNLDLVNWVIKHPVLLSIGGNQGEVNTFAGLDIANITGGVLNAEKLLEGNNLVCFGLTALKTFVPVSLTSSVLASLGPLVKLLDDLLLHPLLDLSCPAFTDLTLGGQDLWSGLLDCYPGARQSGMAF